MKKISILGSTGSIGTQSLEVARKNNMKVLGLTANSNLKLLEQQAREFNPEMVCIYDEKYYNDLKIALKDTNIKVSTGMEGLCQVASLNLVDTVINSVVGMIGLKPTLCAIENKKDVALANKETLVAGGKIVMEKAKVAGVSILPVDSEHSAIFQCLQGNYQNKINKIFLTASGGPFFGKTKQDLENVTVKDALNHPNWSMGSKITIDSATLMNKGLELIEAVWLFDVAPIDIEVVVHRESVIHSAVEFQDFSVIAQLGVPDMKIPIQYSLTYPNRFECETKRLSLTDYGSLTFKKPDLDTFVCLKACIEAIGKGGLYPALVNGVNEKAVELFLQGKIKFSDIGELVYKSLSLKVGDYEKVEDVINVDKLGREFVLNNIK